MVDFFFFFFFFFLPCKLAHIVVVMPLVGPAD